MTDESLRRLLDSLPAMVCQWDRDLLNVVANVAFAEFVGMTPAEIRGRSFAEVFDKNLRRLNPADLDAVLAGEQRLAECELTDRHGMARRFQTAYVPDIVSGAVTGFYLQATELTSHVAHEQACEDEARMFRTCVENAPIGQAIADTSLQGLYVNPAFCSMFGCTVEEALSTNFREFVSPEDIEVAEADLAALKNDPNSHVATELRVVRRDGTAIWVQRNAVMVPAGHDSRDILIGQFQDITARKQAEAELARLAVTDPLTGLLNRQALVDSIGRQRDVDPSASVGIVFLDLDGFKKINDERGHAVGDAVLVQVAECLTQVVGAPDSVYRLGGDEFVILARVADSESHVTELADLLRRALSGNYDGGGVPVSLTASVGSTWGPIADLEELLHLADARMYRHKARQREGRDSGPE
ncbi:MAG: diguanylate cyclase [Mycobacterium sp.]|nr:diguanylate cyclase [Mycobacterium sp.]